jgi:hemin uptake protein HemP
MYSTSPKTTGHSVSARPASTAGGRGPHPDLLDSAILLAGGNEVLIRHGTDTYRLRITRQNRLILTK